jgi:hypothetical protein
MIKLFSESDYKNSKETDLLPLECVSCSNTFYKTKITIRNAMNPKRKETCKSCSQKCTNELKTKKIIVHCNQCGLPIKKHPSQLKLYPVSYCSKSCASKYSNAHKVTGNNRSKLEIWLEEQLTQLYPTLPIDYNKTSAINAELDIYIPSLKLAFEINGIFHYEPIFGTDKFNKTQNNDKRKFQACIENGISLCIIDSSSLKYFKVDKAREYLNIITDIIRSSLSTN